MSARNLATLRAELAEMDAAPRGTCPVCERADVLLRLDGTLIMHAAPDGYRCAVKTDETLRAMAHEWFAPAARRLRLVALVLALPRQAAKVPGWAR